ncbi:MULTISPECIES: hypothetical protein [Pseudomonas]|uniref:Uncharacterized protein n=1 Tax=Pseudomonas aeruginosa TaxID=287 RepID=A0A509JPQ2_PSEAI|nr:MULTISPECIES: hypothetical protein [Pseudomonas]EQL41872.1 hypothetical protein M770_08190 [Pseudomonas aeruginosa VRFPA03]AON73797.1 hypothetical protein BG483_22105 [Pseudomonas aeruginosa]ASP06819.1 hypothetical protein CGU46_18685 [Pseudomonas aeruginosa]ASP14576.1 hypothetical protein CGU45_25705 [Pseudomonas aeruginosa]AVZ36183.1 hypothetical protein B8B76_23830 [Pseudomonas aeruginosa]
MVMLISRRVGIVRLDAVISENLAQAAGSVVETGQEAAVSARGDKLITIVGSIVDHAPADEPLPSLLPMEGGSRALNEYRVRKGIAALTSLQGASETVDVQTGFHLYRGLFITRVVARQTAERGLSLTITASQRRARRVGGRLLKTVVRLFHAGRATPCPAR